MWPKRRPDEFKGVWNIVPASASPSATLIYASCAEEATAALQAIAKQMSKPSDMEEVKRRVQWVLYKLNVFGVGGLATDAAKLSAVKVALTRGSMQVPLRPSSPPPGVSYIEHARGLKQNLRIDKALATYVLHDG